MVEIWMPPTIKDKTGLTLLCILEEDEEDNNKEHMTKEEKNVVNVVAKPSFPFLDMRMFVDKEGNLEFGVYRKEGQALKYVDRQSLHRETVLKSIGKGVFTHLIRLTSVTEKNNTMTIDEVYPEHMEALRRAGLTPKKFPMFEDQ
eukprot:3031160-Ditylum_brightwellii.AAC.2